ncbi:helix-turn-helix domain-containing protein [Actinomadura violacea]|uniref:helix-turn-helix domain-containing protein n=1 Tax=Actinomadura violacea TaxID=2819934 RepID=UPI0027DBFC96|nr:helix-turn-helix domain-containing protein [Actinomadura violacea]
MSAALNGSGRLPEATRRHVRDVAHRLGYRPNATRACCARGAQGCWGSRSVSTPRRPGSTPSSPTSPSSPTPPAAPPSGTATASSCCPRPHRATGGWTCPWTAPSSSIPRRTTRWSPTSSPPGSPW